MESHEEYLIDKVGRNNVFLVPGDYFEELPGRLISAAALRQELAYGEDTGLDVRIAAFTRASKSGSEPGEGYFDSLHSKIMSRIAQLSDVEFKRSIATNENASGVLRTLNSRPRTSIVRQILRYSVAASLTGVLVFSGIKVGSYFSSRNNPSKMQADERFLSRYDIDESAVEGELVTPNQSGWDRTTATGSKAGLNTGLKGTGGVGIGQTKNADGHSDSYILEHADEHSLMEEI